MGVATAKENHSFYLVRHMNARVLESAMTGWRTMAAILPQYLPLTQANANKNNCTFQAEFDYSILYQLPPKKREKHTK